LRLDARPIRDRRKSSSNMNVSVTVRLLPKQKVSST
jgi:hypothetical protein